MRLSFVLDQRKCTGCQACQLACVIENRLDPDQSWRRIYTFNERHYPGAPLFHLSMACNHCGDPACMRACPALAYSRDRTTGIVSLDTGKCIGCRYCTWACPYDAPKFAERAGTVGKCTLCADRLSRGLEPACVDLCPTGALTLERLDEAAITNDVPGFTKSDLRPAIKIIAFSDGRRDTGQAALDLAARKLIGRERPRSKVTLRSEWPLAVFTFMASFLVALFAAAVTAGDRVSPAVFGPAAALAMTLGGAHLGKKDRAWRIVLNVGRSWLSREIALFSVFVVVALLYLWIEPLGSVLAWAVTMLGFLTLLVLDMVYRYALSRSSGVPHSASTFLTGLLFAGVLASHPALAGVAGVTKLVLYTRRRIADVQRRDRRASLVGGIRLLLGLILPAALWIAGGESSWLVVAFVLVGEVIDRCEFYAGLQFMTPELQMAMGLTSDDGRTTIDA